MTEPYTSCPTCRTRHPKGWACPRELAETKHAVEEWERQVDLLLDRAEAAEAKLTTAEAERDSAREQNKKFGLALIMIAGDALDTPENAKASRGIAQAALRIASEKGEKDAES